MSWPRVLTPPCVHAATTLAAKGLGAANLLIVALTDVEAPGHVGLRFADSKPLDRFLPMMRRQGCASPLCGENCFVTSVTAV